VARISQRLRRLVTVRAKNRGEYCLSPAEQTGIPMTIDHIIPRAKGGVSNEDNLCLACSRCNGRKRDQTRARDPATGRWARLFHPRYQRWTRHFQWSNPGTRIMGRTACGRATVEALQMNHPDIVRARTNWVVAGWHPPQA
jgi:5-methylcytosine-specific restriction endonuclease McrA